MRQYVDEYAPRNSGLDRALIDRLKTGPTPTADASKIRRGGFKTGPTANRGESKAGPTARQGAR